MNYEQRVQTRADVRALYERVIADPAIARYRGYTEAKSYGWDAVQGDVIKHDGEHWFENPSYDASIESVELSAESETEALEEVCDRSAERDELCALIDALNDQIAERERAAQELEQERDDARAQLCALREAFAVIRRWLLAE